MPYQVTERLYIDAAGKVYTQSELTERTEAVLLATEGSELSDADAEKYGLSAKAPKAKADDDDDTEAKAVEKAPANKAASSSATKA